MKHVTLFFTAFLITNGADAATFRLEHDGAALPGGEVCLFEARSKSDPLQRMTAFRDVSCSSADREVPLPRGQWNLFARHRDGYVSRALLLVEDGQVENGTRTIPLVPSATLRIEAKLGKGDTAAAYVEETGHVVPLVPGEDLILVPAGRKILPLFMSNGNVRSVGVARTHRRGEQDVASRAGVATAVALIPDARAFERIAPRDRAAASVLFTHEGRAVPLVNAVDPAFDGRPAIAFFSHPVALTGIARLSGAGWSVDEVNVTASRADRPLVVAPTTTLSVHWSLIDDPVRLAEQLRQAPTCRAGDETTRRDVKGVEDKGLTLTIARCPGLQAAVPAMSVRKESCAAESTIPLDDTEVAGLAVLNDVAAGVHLLRLGYEGLPPIFQVVEVDREDAEASVDLKYDRWFGKVTRDGEPVHVKVDIGNGAITHPDTGEYFTISTPRTAPPPEIAHRLFKEPLPVHLVGCTGETQFFYVPAETPAPNTRFDIEIASNTVEVAVRDSENDRKIEGAKVVYSAVRKTEPERILFGGAVGVTDADGSVSVADVPPDVEMQFCATHDSYQQRCADRFTMNTLRSRQVTIALDPAADRHGRVLHPNATEGRVQWFTPAGEVSEMASIKSDGSFTYKSEHGSNEIVAVIGPRTPLLVTRQPNVGDGEVFEIKFPAAPVRTYTVTLLPGAKETKGFLTLSVGDIAVPLRVIDAHLRERDMRPLFLSPGSIVFHDIVAHGPVAFIFAPMSWAETHAAGSTRDAFYVPAAVSLPRFPAGNDGNVVIGGEHMRQTPEALTVNARR